MTHTNSVDTLEPALVIYATPQISITQLEIGDVQIDTVRIGPDYKSVVHESVIIPREHAKDIAQTILALLKPRSTR